MTERVGIVLAGGFARRFGDRDKTMAELDGRPLIAHAVDTLSTVVDAVVVSCRSEQVEAFEAVLDDVEYRPDPTPDQGPLAGLSAALDGLDAEMVVVATADRPCIPGDLYRYLLAEVEEDGVVIRADGIRQPAPAVFRLEPLRKAVRTRRAAGVQRLRAVFEDLDLNTVDADAVRTRWGREVLTDVNTREDLDVLRSG